MKTINLLISAFCTLLAVILIFRNEISMAALGVALGSAFYNFYLDGKKADK